MPSRPSLFRSPAVRKAFRDSLPVLAGYLFLGAGFGILLVEKGFPLWMAPVMALTIYAGSGQYLAVDLMSGGASLISTAVLTFVINARHFFYGLTMLLRYRDMKAAKPYLIFSLTDETFSLVCRENATDGVDAKTYYLSLSLMNQFYWLVGCTAGAAAGKTLPVDFSGVDFVMTALFVVIFLDQWRSTTRHLPALVGVGSTVVCLLVFGPERFVIPAMVCIALILTLLRKRLDPEAKS